MTFILLISLPFKGDVKFAEVLEKMGAKVTWTENSVTVTGPPRGSLGRKHLRSVDVNMNKMPDVAMTLAVVALFAEGSTAIRDGMISHFWLWKNEIRRDRNFSLIQELPISCFCASEFVTYMNVVTIFL